jgi:hypothetical protein
MTKLNVSGDKAKFILEDRDDIYGDSYVGFMLKCKRCGEWTDEISAEYCWHCGKKYK